MITTETIIKTFKREVVTEVIGLSYPEAMRNDVIKTGILFADYITHLDKNDMLSPVQVQELDLFVAQEIAKYGDL